MAGLNFEGCNSITGRWEELERRVSGDPSLGRMRPLKLELSLHCYDIAMIRRDLRLKKASCATGVLGGVIHCGLDKPKVIPNVNCSPSKNKLNPPIPSLPISMFLKGSRCDEAEELINDFLSDCPGVSQNIDVQSTRSTRGGRATNTNAANK